MTTSATTDRREERYTPGIELRKSIDGPNTVGTLDGYAAVFDTLSEDMGGYREKISRGAFARSIASRDVFAFLDHRPGDLLGRTSSGTLRIAEDAKGLPSQIDLPNATAGRDAAAYVARGDIRGMSFAFEVVEGGESWDFTGPIPIRTLTDLILYEVSPCRNPAYVATSIALRSLDAARKAIPPIVPDPPTDSAPAEEPAAPADHQGDDQADAAATAAAVTAAAIMTENQIRSAEAF